VTALSLAVFLLASSASPPQDGFDRSAAPPSPWWRDGARLDGLPPGADVRLHLEYGGSLDARLVGVHEDSGVVSVELDGRPLDVAPELISGVSPLVPPPAALAGSPPPSLRAAATGPSPQAAGVFVLSVFAPGTGHFVLRDPKLGGVLLSLDLVMAGGGAAALALPSGQLLQQRVTVASVLFGLDVALRIGSAVHAARRAGPRSP
jgi:hypothetical protein